MAVTHSIQERERDAMNPWENIQTETSLQFALYGGYLFLAIQFALSCAAPGFYGHRVYSFFLMALIGVTAGCAGWACGIVLSPMGSQASGSQKVLAGLGVFWTGVVAGHLSQRGTAFSRFQGEAMTQATKIELLFALGIFFFAACVTFNTRFSPAQATTTPLAP
jgi:hypothetical protein